MGKAKVRFGLLIAIAVVGLAACSPGTSVQSAEESSMAGFVLSSPSFTEGGAIPSKHTCDGQDVSPALSWAGAPLATQAFALVVDDPDANGFIHWIAYNIPGGAAGSLREGIHPDAEPPQGRNDFGRTGYGGPCPPLGIHHYRFTLYALSTTLAFGVTPTAPDLDRAVSDKTLAKTALTGTYSRHR
jgi:Raf kinase inhibitor-like YbhB/YbcL family protein